MDKDRAKKLDTVFDQIEKQFGEGSLMKLGTDNVKKGSCNINRCFIDRLSFRDRWNT